MSLQGIYPCTGQRWWGTRREVADRLKLETRCSNADLKVSPLEDLVHFLTWLSTGKYIYMRIKEDIDGKKYIPKRRWSLLFLADKLRS